MGSVSPGSRLPQPTVLAPATLEPPVITDLESQNKSVAFPETWVNAFGGSHSDRRQVGHNQTTVIAPGNASAGQARAYQLTVRRPRKHYSRRALSIGDRRSVKSCT